MTNIKTIDFSNWLYFTIIRYLPTYATIYISHKLPNFMDVRLLILRKTMRLVHMLNKRKDVLLLNHRKTIHFIECFVVKRRKNETLPTSSVIVSWRPGYGRMYRKDVSGQNLAKLKYPD